MLAITGVQESSVLGTGYQQEVHLDRLFADVAVFNQVVLNPAQLPALVDIAMRAAYTRRGVAHLCVPSDIQVAEAGQDPYATAGADAAATKPFTFHRVSARLPVSLTPPRRCSTTVTR